MMNAYYALRAGAENDALRRKDHMVALLKGTNAAWAWFALRNLRSLSDIEKTALCTIAVKSGNGEIVVWCLEETCLNQGQRSMLKNMLANTKITSLAHMALERVNDLSEVQKLRLTRIASGQDPDIR